MPKCDSLSPSPMGRREPKGKIMLLKSTDAHNTRNAEINVIEDHGFTFEGFRVQIVKAGTEQCRHCQGHGGWNLVLDFYEPGRHMKTVCAECNGAGCVALPKRGKITMHAEPGSRVFPFRPSTPEMLRLAFERGRADYNEKINRDVSDLQRDEREAYSRGWNFAKHEA